MNTCRICGKEIGKTYSDKKLRCSSCRKSVENAIGYNERTVEYVEDELFAWKSEYKKLKKENKKLNEKVRFLEECLDRKEKVNKSLREENKKLKDIVERTERDRGFYYDNYQREKEKSEGFYKAIQGKEERIEQLEDERKDLLEFIREMGYKMGMKIKEINVGDRRIKLEEDTYVYDAKQVRDIC